MKSRSSRVFRSARWLPAAWCLQLSWASLQVRPALLTVKQLLPLAHQLGGHFARERDYCQLMPADSRWLRCGCVCGHKGNVHNTCFHADAESLLQCHIKLFVVCLHCNFGLEASARQEIFHCVLRLCCCWVDVEVVCERLCVNVVKAQGGKALLAVKFPCQESSSCPAVYMKGGQGDWN